MPGRSRASPATSPLIPEGKERYERVRSLGLSSAPRPCLRGRCRQRASGVGMGATHA
jgi:hypothetical protein